MLIEDHWLDCANRQPSPNYNDRPDESDISLLVIHNISLPPFNAEAEAAKKDYVTDFFLNKLDYDEHPYFQEIVGLEVSSHLYIRRDGEMIQYVPFNKRAWHAGRSQYQQRENCNDFSIGIELEGCDDVAYTKIQYQQLESVTEAIFSAYPEINAHRITGHEFIAPIRKTDPGRAFNWQQYFRRLASK